MYEIQGRAISPQRLKQFFTGCFLLVLFWVWGSDAIAREPSSVPLDYRVAIGDELNFRFQYVPELNTVVSVRSDGRLSLPLIGELSVDSLTLAELTERVEQLMLAHLRRPQVTINVQGSSARRIFVGGEVVQPGVQPLLGPLTVLQAVTVAQGVKDSAQLRKTIVLRRGLGGTAHVIVVDLVEIMSGQDVSQDLLLQSYDVVIVPRSGVAELGLWVDQYIKRFLPYSLGFSYTINQVGGSIR